MAQVFSFEGVIPVIDPAAYVHPTAVLIGDVIIGPGCYVGPAAVMRGDFGRLVMEAGSNLQDTCVVHGFPSSDTIIGENGHVGHGAVLHSCIVGRNALIGMNAVVMDGAVIGEDAFVAAMAFVKAGFHVPPRTLVAGVPGKVIRTLTADEIAWKSEGTLEYQKLARRCAAGLRPAKPLRAIEPGRMRVSDDGTTDPLYMAKARFS